MIPKMAKQRKETVKYDPSKFNFGDDDDDNDE